jgi:hypothetical protein
MLVCECRRNPLHDHDYCRIRPISVTAEFRSGRSAGRVRDRRTGSGDVKSNSRTSRR